MSCCEETTPDQQNNPRPTRSSDVRIHDFRSKLPALVAHMVSTDKIKAHLVLTGALMKLFKMADGDATPAEGDASSAFRSFLRRGVYRLELWLENIVLSTTNRSSIEAYELPPLDVVSLWHALVLAPFRYYEDCHTKYKQLYNSGAFPILELARLVDTETSEYGATTEQVKFWEEKTGVPFDPFEHMKISPTHTIRCPQCASVLTVMWEDGGKGYSETGFQLACAQCGAIITHDKLCGAIFLKDLHAVLENEDAILAGTLLDSRGEVDRSRAREIALEVVKALRSKDGSLPSAKDLALSDVRRGLENAQGTKLRTDRVEALLRPYSQDSPFIHDLVKAVVVMRLYNSRLADVGWYDKDYLSGPCIELENARDRFYTFLELIMYPENGPISAPLDVDLLWHTMQLGGPEYRDVTMSLLGLYVDHIPYEEEPEAFDSSLERTKEQWSKVREDDFMIPLPTQKMHEGGSEAHSRGTSGTRVLEANESPIPDTVEEATDENCPTDKKCPCLGCACIPGNCEDCKKEKNHVAFNECKCNDCKCKGCTCGDCTCGNQCFCKKRHCTEKQTSAKQFTDGVPKAEFDFKACGVSLSQDFLIDGLLEKK